MRISVVTPSLNQAPFLTETLESVLTQEAGHLEYIVVEGGSTDGSPEIIQTNLDRGIRLVDAPGTNQAEAINRGLALAGGDVLAWLNSDDLYQPGALSRVLRVFREEPSTDVVYGFELSLNAAGEVWGLRKAPARITPESVRWHGISLPQPAVFWRRRVYEELGGLDPSFDCTLDLEYWLRMARGGYAFRCLPQVLAATRFHRDSKSGDAPGGAGRGPRGARFRDEALRAFFHHGGIRYSPFHLRNRLLRRTSNRWILAVGERLIRWFGRRAEPLDPSPGVHHG